MIVVVPGTIYKSYGRHAKHATKNLIRNKNLYACVYELNGIIYHGTRIISGEKRRKFVDDNFDFIFHEAIKERDYFHNNAPFALMNVHEFGLIE